MTADPASSDAGPKNPIICFSHLAWDAALYQRPQQIMSRLALLGYPVIYFACVGNRRHKKNPMAGAVAGAPGVSVYTLPFAPGITKLRGLRRLVASLKVASVMAEHKVHNPILWYYHPSLFALGYAHSDSAIIYDVMDHFPSFEQSTDDLYFDELALLAEADITFAGGRSLDRHIRAMVHQLYQDVSADACRPVTSLTDIHCYPSGIDMEHFQKAMDPATEPLSLKHEVSRPCFGYFGAIDERIHWPTIAELAEKISGSVVMAGPILTQPPGSLPGNVLLPGPIDYSDLPALLAGFDVCMLPFKDTPLVSYISPTKTPEYLAGGKPVVSTPIPDVVTDYGDIVRIANPGPAFVQACIAAATNSTPAEVLARHAAKRARTWDEIASDMHNLVQKKIAG